MGKDKIKVRAFTQDGCPACDDMKKEVKEMKKSGTLCYDVKFCDVEKNPKLAKDVEFTPTCEILDGPNKGKRYFWDQIRDRCPVGK